MYTIAPTAINDADLTALIARLDAYQESLYPAESNHLVDLSQLAAESVIVLLIRDARQRAVGCGAIVLGNDGVGEMKRVFIDPHHRGQQLGERLLAALETQALHRDCHTVRLETGIHQQAAIRLYTRWGYQTRIAFAPYQPDPLSLFMEKLLVADLRSAAL
ncbi:GNAT family N-acetyltransferase [Raoultella sp. Lac2]|uniref:GNAT family N-acetyltransferase n=1 Tax=unclassified Raoultella TaxID=2627600 RepID=UPI0013536124|nr:GNAT family N-acetyltransferase [Raoultella sp. Lac2]MXF98555.1 GNAT family N-acetyltransferase [Raoultella sp. Lac1]